MDLRADLPRIAAPTLVISAPDDLATPLEHQRADRRGASPARGCEILDPAAHLANVEQPDAVDRADPRSTCRHERRRRYEAGMQVRREVLGDEHVDRAIESATDFTRAVPGVHHPLRVGRRLDARRARPAHAQLHHAGGARPRSGRERARACTSARRRRNGLTPEEIREVLLHTAVYAGVPAANAAFAIAQRVLARRRARSPRPSATARSCSRSSAGCSVIRALSAPEPLTLSDVARTTGLTRAAARRFLLTLDELGYVRQTAGASRSRRACSSSATRTCPA